MSEQLERGVLEIVEEGRYGLCEGGSYLDVDLLWLSACEEKGEGGVEECGDKQEEHDNN